MDLPEWHEECVSRAFLALKVCHLGLFAARDKLKVLGGSADARLRIAARG